MAEKKSRKRFDEKREEEQKLKEQLIFNSQYEHVWVVVTRHAFKISLNDEMSSRK